MTDGGDWGISPGTRLSNIEKRLGELEKSNQELVNQMSFLKGAITVLGFLVGSGTLTTIIILLAVN